MVFNLILTMFIWGTLGAFILWSGLHPLDASFFRCLIGGATLLGYCLYTKSFKSRLTRWTLFLIISQGIFIVLNWILLFQSFIWTSITLGNMSYYLQPGILVFMNFIFFKERITMSSAALIFVAFIGVILTADISQQNLMLDKLKIYGLLLAIFAAILYSIATIIAKYIKHIPVSFITLIQLTTGTFILLPFVDWSSISFSNKFVIYILILGIVHTAIAYILYYRSVRSLSITTIAVMSYVDPIIAIFTDVVFFGQHLTSIQMLGIGVTMIASFFVTRGSHPNLQQTLHAGENRGNF